MEFRSGVHTSSGLFDYFFDQIPDKYRTPGFFIKANAFNINDPTEFCQLYECFHEHEILRDCQKLRHIPNLVFSKFTTDGMSIIITDEYFKIPRNKKYRQDNFFFSLKSTLNILHERGIYHNDVSPWNLMFDNKKQDLVLIDFNGANFGFGSRYSYAWNKIVDPCWQNDLAMLAITFMLLRGENSCMSGRFFQKIKEKKIYREIKRFLGDDGDEVVDWIDFVLSDSYQAQTPSGGKAAGVNPYIVSISNRPV